MYKDGKKIRENDPAAKYTQKFYRGIAQQAKPYPVEALQAILALAEDSGYENGFIEALVLTGREDMLPAFPDIHELWLQRSAVRKAAENVLTIMEAEHIARQGR